MRMCKVPNRISHGHTLSEDKTAKGRFLGYAFKRMVKKLVNYNATQFLACSYEVGHWLYGEAIVKRDKFKVIRNAICAKSFAFNEDVRASVRADMNLGDNFVIGHIGNFTQPKNYPFILQIFESILLKEKNSVLVLVGNYQNDLTVHQRVKELGLEGQVLFTGIRSDISRLLQAMDVFLFPSLFEGLPVTLIEAQASGLPCFVSDVVTEEVKVTNGVYFLSLNQSSQVWADEIVSVMKFYQRESTCVEICDAGYDVTQNTELLQSFYLDSK